MSWRASTTLSLTACGAVAFGAVYPWAFLPLFLGCALVGGAAFLQRNGTSKAGVILAAAFRNYVDVFS